MRRKPESDIYNEFGPALVGRAADHYAHLLLRSPSGARLIIVRTEGCHETSAHDLLLRPFHLVRCT